LPPVNDLRVRREQSEALWAKVDTFAIRSEFGAALEVAREAATVFPPAPEHDAMIAWLILQHAGCHESVHPQVLRGLDRAHKRDPLCEQVLYYKGLVFNLIGDAEAAQAEFQRVLMIKPDHPGANREIRIYEMRKAHARSETSFLRRLLLGRKGE
jgi:tetratricopeptide (TPR) repeat protein